jgi:membrane protein insertase Oxa1/YidC/SpoIIIJ
MAFISPAMIAVFGFRGQWPSALILYWLSLNVFTMAQQIWLFRRFGLMGGKASTANVVAVAPSAEKNVTAQGSKNAKNRGKAAAGKGAKR